MPTPGKIAILLVILQAFIGVSSAQMPIGIPPKAEMPVLSQVAPDECVLYMSFAGTEAPKADAANQTERLLAEPQVQAMIKTVDSFLQQMIYKNKNSAAPDAAYRMAKQLLTCPWCVFVSDFTIENLRQPPKIHAGAMIYLGDQQKTFEKNLQAIFQKINLPADVPTVTIGGKKFNQLPIGPQNTITWGIHDQTLYVGIGDDTIAAMLDRAKTPTPVWLTELKKELPIERRATTIYVNLTQIRQTVVTALIADDNLKINQIQAFSKAFGLDNLKTLKASTGLDEKGMVELIYLEADGPLTGLLTNLVGSSLTADELAIVPADANLVSAFKIDPVKLYRSIGQIADSFRPGMSQMLNQQACLFVGTYGFKDFKEFLQGIGDTWILYNSPSEGGPFLTGLTLSVEVNDSFAKARSGIETFLTMMSQQDKDVPMPTIVNYKETQITYLKFQREPLPIAPAWCIKDGRLIISLVPQNLRTILNRDAATFKPITTVPEVAQALAQNPAPSSLLYLEPKSILQRVYPMLPYLANGVASVIRQEEKIDLDALNIPDLPTILPYAKPMISTIRNTGSSLMLETHTTLPGITLSSGSIPMFLGVTASVKRTFDVSSHRKKSRTNMKMLLIALHNHHSVHGDFPPAYTVDKKGKPLLSWRVAMLPYLEENMLYEQFKLDEPWDSEHNKKLIARMPALFKSPRSKAGQGKTTYLTVRAEDSAFPGKEKVGVVDVCDGTSNTVILVEVTDAKAVTWTKPGDFVPDEKDPTKGLKGIYPGKILVGFCDGSARMISDSIDKDSLRALFTKNGGEIIDHEANDQ